MEVDAFLQKTLPELLEAEFTAGMEDKLDAIAAGKENWERYLVGWNADYFAPALERALKVIGEEPSAGGGGQTNTASDRYRESRLSCPSCGRKMVEIPSKSKKLHKPYFLKCPDNCGTVMFYDKRRKTWELPGTKREGASRSNAKIVSPANSTGKVGARAKNESPANLHPCPVCGERLIEREYERDGQKKRMLVCSSPTARTDGKHEGVVYFESRNVFWSKKYGEIPLG